MINKMIKKYNDFINEKLSDKLSGFDADGLKQQFLSKEIDISKYINLCKQYNLEMPPLYDLKKYYDGSLIDIYEFLETCYEYKFKLPSPKNIKELYSEHIINFETYSNICSNFNIEALLDENIKKEIFIYPINEILLYSVIFNYLDGVKYAINHDAYYSIRIFRFCKNEEIRQLLESNFKNNR